MATITNSQPNGAHTVVPAAKVALSQSTTGIFHVPQITPESAKSASELLQKNHVKNHIFFNQDGFHNHIAHHLLTIYSLGATPNQLQRGFASNDSYQRPQLAIKTDVIKEMTSSRAKIANYFGQERYFHDFEQFFENEIESKGVKGTLDEWVFKGDDIAEGMFTRLFAGFYHPIIHFGFGLEFHQPAILVESLAQTAIHDNWIAPFIQGAEKSARLNANKSTKKTLIQLLHEARANDTIRNSPHREDGNKVRDGVIARASEPMIEIASQWIVQPTVEDLKFKTAEMIQTAFYFAAGAQNPKKIPKFDFFYMHCTNASIFYSSFLEDPQNQSLFVDTEAARKNLVRLLEAKGRTDLALYISRGSPELHMDRIKTYEPTHPDQSWAQIFERACALDDDGHTAKLIRATANAERVCKDYEDKENWPVKGDMWLKIGHMVMDSVEPGEPHWVRNAGWEEAWKDIPDRKDAKL